MEGFVGGIPTPAVMACCAAGPAGVGNGVGDGSATDSTIGVPTGRVEGNGVVVGDVVSLQADERSMNSAPVTANNTLRFTFYFSPYNTESFTSERLPDSEVRSF